MADNDVDFTAISKAASRQEQTVTQAAVVEASKEEDDLFQREIRKSLLRGVKTLINYTLFLFCVIVAVRVWHLLIPNWGWIDDEHLKDIDSLLKSGALVAAGGIAKDVIIKSIPTDRKAS